MFREVTLEPGQYVIRLMNHDHNRNIVQIFNEREDHLFTTVLAIPNYRLVPKDKHDVRFLGDSARQSESLSGPGSLRRPLGPGVRLSQGPGGDHRE